MVINVTMGTLVPVTFDGSYPGDLMEPWKYAASAAVLFFIGFFGFFLNLSVIILMCKDKQLWTPLNVILFNLVCSDLSVSVLGNPWTLMSALSHRWLWGSTMCVLYGFFMALLGITSINTLTVLSFERYLLVSHPLSPRKLSKGGAIAVVALIWVYSICITAPPLFGWGAYVNEAANISCSVNWEEQTWNSMTYIVFLFALGLVIPMMIISFSYINIIRTLRQNSQRMGRVSRAEGRVTWMVAAMILAFMIAWSPYSVLALIEQFAPPHVRAIVTPGVAVIPALIAKSSICYNPLIYVGMNTQFRVAWKRLFGSEVRGESSVNHGTMMSPEHAPSTGFNNASMKMSFIRSLNGSGNNNVKNEEGDGCLQQLCEMTEMGSSDNEEDIKNIDNNVEKHAHMTTDDRKKVEDNDFSAEEDALQSELIDKSSERGKENSDLISNADKSSEKVKENSDLITNADKSSKRGKENSDHISNADKSSERGTENSDLITNADKSSKRGKENSDVITNADKSSERGKENSDLITNADKSSEHSDGECKFSNKIEVNSGDEAKNNVEVSDIPQTPNEEQKEESMSIRNKTSKPKLKPLLLSNYLAENSEIYSINHHYTPNVIIEHEHSEYSNVKKERAVVSLKKTGTVSEILEKFDSDGDIL